MIATARTLAIMLAAPPLMLLFWAHLIRPTVSGLDLLAMFLAGATGLAGAATGPWSGQTKALVAIVYIVLGVGAIPFWTLFAVCSTGDCL
ncbi:hypothetical protein [Sphingomonas psychrotolerans]|uniref:Uncharacterized protein n=1 Tax=Sphingomonas psychrotolerans TaxID=1327635 RepID=A0A2K8MHH5_9SPHN|nr:hypothetical protein [Sphingomonas psychrotolerans]ATY33335.1 hypothetical protein CVN68_16325 [Sphingomonas psychrotolerans]